MARSSRGRGARPRRGARPETLARLADLIRIPSVSAEGFPAAGGASLGRGRGGAAARSPGSRTCSSSRCPATTPTSTATGYTRPGRCRRCSSTGTTTCSREGDPLRWIEPALRAHRRDGRLYGRGTVDDKGTFITPWRRCAPGSHRGTPAGEREVRRRGRGRDWVARSPEFLTRYRPKGRRRHRPCSTTRATSTSSCRRSPTRSAASDRWTSRCGASSSRSTAASGAGRCRTPCASWRGSWPTSRRRTARSTCRGCIGTAREDRLAPEAAAAGVAVGRFALPRLGGDEARHALRRRAGVLDVGAAVDAAGPHRDRARGAPARGLVEPE